MQNIMLLKGNKYVHVQKISILLFLLANRFISSLTIVGLLMCLFTYVKTYITKFNILGPTPYFYVILRKGVMVMIKT